MKTVYACTFIEKEVEVDDFEKGCIGGRTCVMNQRVNIVAPTLSLLIESIGNYMSLNIDDVWLPEQESTHIGFNRLEDADGNPASQRLEAAWKHGEAKLYLADYHFAIERRVVSVISRQDFDVAEIKVHF